MLNKLLNLSRPFFCVDVETTGLDVKVDRIVEIGFQRYIGAFPDGMDKEWRSLVDPGVPIPSSATKVHGITDASFALCQTCQTPLVSHPVGRASEEIDHACITPKSVPTFAQLAASLARGFRDCDYAGKNVRFDLRVLSSEFARAGVAWDYVGARIVDADRLEALAVPRTLSHLHEKYVRSTCLQCGGRGRVLTEAQTRNLSEGAPWSDRTLCPNCDGLGTIGMKHDGAHGALSDVRASATVIAAQLKAHPTLPRSLDVLHEAQWPGYLVDDGSFRTVDGVAICQFGKHRGKPMRAIPRDYFDWILSSDFPADVKALAREAKLGRFPGDS